MQTHDGNAVAVFAFSREFSAPLWTLPCQAEPG
jgi:hypothetical protein